MMPSTLLHMVCHCPRQNASHKLTSKTDISVHHMTDKSKVCLSFSAATQAADRIWFPTSQQRSNILQPLSPLQGVLVDLTVVVGVQEQM